MKIPNFLRPSKKKLIILVVLLIATVMGFNFFGRKKQTPLQFAQVKRQDIRSIVSSSGILTGKNVVDLKFKSSGKLAYLNVKLGDKVSAWQVIAGLDTQGLNIDLQQAQNTLRDKQAIVEKALDDIKDHSKDESFAQKKDRTAAEVARDNAYDSVKEAQRAFEDAVIVSPTAGLITQVNPIPGQNVSTSDVIARVVDFSEILFDSDIDEADIGKISVGQKAEVTLDAYPDKTFRGSVKEIIPQTKTTSSGATVVTVRISLDTEVASINGLSGQTSIILAEAKDVLTVPLEAVREDNVVFVQGNQRMEQKKVVTGIKSDTDVEIKEGLEENQRVLLNPPSQGNGNFQNRSQNPLNNVFRFLRSGGGR